MTLEEEIYTKLKEYGSAFDDRRGVICYEDFKDLASDIATILRSRQKVIAEGEVEEAVFRIAKKEIAIRFKKLPKRLAIGTLNNFEGKEVILSLEMKE